MPGTEAAIGQGYAKPIAALIMVVGILLGAWVLNVFLSWILVLTSHGRRDGMERGYSR